MFTHLFFLLAFLLLTNFESEMRASYWIIQPLEAWSWGTLLYTAFIPLIAGQAWICAKRRLSFSHYINVINVELLLFFCVYYFGIGAQRFLIVGTPPYAVNTYSAIFSLTLYLVGLGWAYFFAALLRLIETNSSLSYAYRNIQFLFPFCLPFICFSLLLDPLNLIPAWVNFQKSETVFSVVTLLGINVLLLILTIIFMPALIVRFWRCKPLPNFELSARIEALCQLKHFKHAGIKIWTIMKHSFTAGIIGVVPQFRYIMFTERLIQSFAPEEIEAILIHEIGHSRYKHLLFYPFIFLGMVIIGAFFFLFFTEPILNSILLYTREASQSTQAFLLKLSLFLPYIILIGLYFRFIFGFFSRLFERQADLHIFEYPVAPTHMIKALDHIGVVSGYIHDEPSWHHFSIRERINFLQIAIKHPHTILLHHYKVKFYLTIYFICLTMSCFLLVILNYFL